MADVKVRYIGDTSSLDAATACTTRSLSNLGKQTQQTQTKLSSAQKATNSAARSFSGLDIGAGIAAAGIGALALSFKTAISEALISEKTTHQTTAALRSTGGAAHVSAGQIEELANKISLKSGIDDEAIQSGANLLLTFTNIRNEVGKGNNIFDQATQAVTDVSVAMGQDLSKSAIQVGKALNDPIKGMGRLQRIGVTFTDQQKAQVKALVESGDRLSAQKIILAELTKEFGGSAEAQATSIDKLRVSSKNLAESVGKIILPRFESTAAGLSLLADGLAHATDRGNTFGSVVNQVFPTLGGLFDNAASSTAHLDKQTKELDDAIKTLAEDTAKGAGADVLAKDAKAVTEAQKKQNTVQNALGKAIGDATPKTKAQIAADKAAKKAAEDAAKGIYSLAAAYKAVGGAAEEASRTSLENFNTAIFSNKNAQIESQQAGEDLLTTIAGLSGAQDEAASSTTTAAQAMFDQIGKANALRDAQQGASDATYDLKQAQIDFNGSVVAAANALRNYNAILHGVAADSVKGQNAEENLARARLAQRSANLNIRDAERALSKARREGTKDDVRRAEIQLATAKLDAKDATVAANEAQRIYNGTLHGFSVNSREARDAQEKLRDAHKNEHGALITLREAYDTVKDSVDDVRHAQLDLKGAFDSTSGASKKAKTSIEDVQTAALKFATTVPGHIGKGNAAIAKAMLIEAQTLEAIEAAIPALGHAFDAEIAKLRATAAGLVNPSGQTFRGGQNVTPHAAGGPVNRNQMYLVGEKGPELFVPGSTGTIIPNGGGRTQLNATIVVSETDRGDRLVRQLISAINQGHGKNDLKRALGVA